MTAYLQEPIACFHLGVVAGIALTLSITAVFGWAFIAIVEGQDWTQEVGRVIARWKPPVPPVIGRFAYWQHPGAYVGHLCRVHHRWRWSSRLHWRWQEFRVWLGVAIAGFEQDGK